MTATQLSVLYVIEQKEPVTLGKLAAIEGLAPPSLTRIITSLEDRSLVQRVIDPDDRRSVVASLTSAGRSELERTRAVRNNYLAARLAELDDDDIAALTRATEILESLVEEEI
jgi:DNA-binding MarR family transcriptional regulator